MPAKLKRQTVKSSKITKSTPNLITDELNKVTHGLTQSTVDVLHDKSGAIPDFTVHDTTGHSETAENQTKPKYQPANLQRYPNARDPKKDDMAGFDVGFPIDTYLAAGYILAVLSQNKKPANMKKMSLGGMMSQVAEEEEEGYDLNYALPNKKDTEEFQKMIASLNKRYIFDLAHNALKYKSLFEEVLVESNFFSSNPFGDDQNSLLLVYLVDLHSRNWDFRPEFESDGSSKFVEDFESVEKAIKKSRTKLAASLAKKRVAAQAQSINFSLPEALRAQEQNRGLVPISAWSNNKDNLEKILESEEFEKFEKIEDFTELLQINQYKIDKNLENVVHFCGKQRDKILRMPSVLSKKLIIQEKSSVLAVDSCFRLLNALEPVDILLTNVGSGWTAINLAQKMKVYTEEMKDRQRKMSFLYGKSSSGKVKIDVEAVVEEGEKKDDSDKCMLYTCFNGSQTAYDVIMERIESCGVSEYIKIIRSSFENMNHDSQLSRVKVVLVSAECSRTSVADPIELLIQEGQPDSNMSQLLNLKPQGSEKSADALGGKHVATLRTAMSGLIPNSNAIVYLTRSVHAGENEKVITDALKSQKSNNSSMKWKLSPPVVMLRPSDIATSTGNYLKIMPSAHENGCFIAVLSRRTGQKDDAKEMVKKAALQGLFNVDALASSGGAASSANNTPSRQTSAGAKKSVSISKGFGSTANRK